LRRQVYLVGICPAPQHGWLCTAVSAVRVAMLRRAAARSVVEPLAAAGMTWWTESLEPRRGSLQELRTRVRQGPPGR
jgi:predicted NAD/FAD-dependent oxidoreductase